MLNAQKTDTLVHIRFQQSYNKQMWARILAMMLTLAENDIRTLDDLAGLDNEELVELLGDHGLSDDAEAGDIIMAARAHWFADEVESEDAPTVRSDTVDADDASPSSDS